MAKKKDKVGEIHDFPMRYSLKIFCRNSDTYMWSHQTNDVSYAVKDLREVTKHFVDDGLEIELILDDFQIRCPFTSDFTNICKAKGLGETYGIYN